MFGSTTRPSCTSSHLGHRNTSRVRRRSTVAFRWAASCFTGGRYDENDALQILGAAHLAGRDGNAATVPKALFDLGDFIREKLLRRLKWRGRPCGARDRSAVHTCPKPLSPSILWPCRPSTLDRSEVRTLNDENPRRTPRYELVDGELLVTPSQSNPRDSCVVGSREARYLSETQSSGLV